MVGRSLGSTDPLRFFTGPALSPIIKEMIATKGLLTIPGVLCCSPFFRRQPAWSARSGRTSQTALIREDLEEKGLLDYA